MSQGQATRSTFAFLRVIHFMGHLLSVCYGLIKTFNQINTPFQQALIRNALLCPTNQHPVESFSFRAAELAVLKISVMDDLGQNHDLRIADGKFLSESLKRAILSATDASPL